MDVITIQNELLAHPDKVRQLIEALGFEGIIERDNRFTFKNIGGDNPSGISVYKDTLKYCNFSHGGNGNIFTLVMETKHCTFPESLKYIVKTLHLKLTNVKITLPFGGFYKGLSKPTTGIEEMKHYSEKDLPDAHSLSLKFLKDRILLCVQEKMGVRYDHEQNAILIPIYDPAHNLVGCKARSNDPNVDMGHRWWAHLPYQKTNILYGLDANYTSIIQHDQCFVFEAEKSVMQAMSFDLNTGLAIAGHNFSQTQIKYLRALNVNEIVVSFDQDLDEDEVRYEASKILSTHRNTRVFYLYDRKGKYLPKGSKASPTDFGQDVFLDVYKNCKYEVTIDKDDDDE